MPSSVVWIRPLPASKIQDLQKRATLGFGETCENFGGKSQRQAEKNVPLVAWQVGSASCSRSQSACEYAAEPAKQNPATVPRAS